MKLFFRIIFKIFLILSILAGCATTEEIKETDSDALLNREHYLFLKNCLSRDEVHLVLFENKSAYSFSWCQSLYYQKFHCI